MYILIVEDDLFATHFLEEILKRQGYYVLGTVDNGKDAIDFCKNNPKTEVVMMDVKLKGDMDGVEAAQKILEFRSDMYIFFITAYSLQKVSSFESKHERCFSLSKPYNEEEILQKIKAICSGL